MATIHKLRVYFYSLIEVRLRSIWSELGWQGLSDVSLLRSMRQSFLSVASADMATIHKLRVYFYSLIEVRLRSIWSEPGVSDVPTTQTNPHSADMATIHKLCVYFPCDEVRLRSIGASSDPNHNTTPPLCGNPFCSVASADMATIHKLCVYFCPVIEVRLRSIWSELGWQGLSDVSLLRSMRQSFLLHRFGASSGGKVSVTCLYYAVCGNPFCSVASADMATIHKLCVYFYSLIEVRLRSIWSELGWQGLSDVSLLRSMRQSFLLRSLGGYGHDTQAPCLLLPFD
ncbi:hypothetical protein J6590_062745 [Homalodisca vitripennis]|nr:hypothetical protein J6590_062745 [Homalodisca vitripennis]